MNNTNNKAKLFVGTCGWSYPHWGKGVFYPKALPAQDWLKYYSGIFNSVEINSTFYRLLNHSLFQKWFNITPPKFMFSIKIWRRISHDLKLKDVYKEIRDFHESILPLQDKTKVYLLQMPPSFRPDTKLLEEFFQLWKEVFRHKLLAVELRNKKGLKEEIFNIMKGYNVSLCLEDYKGCIIDNIITADFIYIRRHGPTGRYQGEYTQKQLEMDAKKIKEWLKIEKNVFIFFNNDFNGYAPKNALQLINIIPSIVE